MKIPLSMKPDSFVQRRLHCFNFTYDAILPFLASKYVFFSLFSDDEWEAKPTMDEGDTRRVKINI